MIQESCPQISDRLSYVNGITLVHYATKGRMKPSGQSNRNINFP